MSQKFIGLDDAAEQLGISKDRLNEIRDSGAVRAYRDGASWKFRTEDIEQLQSDGLPDASGGGDEEDDDLVLGVEPLAEGDDAESILLTESDLDVGATRPPSTIIGKTEPSLDDDLTLASDSSVDGLVQDVKPGEGSFADLEELELDLEAESSRILDAGTAAAAAKAAEEAGLASDDDLSGDLALDDDDDDFDLSLDDSEAALKTGELPSLSGSSPSAGSSLTLDGDDDDDGDLLASDSDDFSLSSGDSGINLAPGDSGIALDEVPLDLAGSAIGSALDLAALSAVAESQEKPADGEGLASGEDFLLTPAEDDSDDEDSSQVVAFEEVSEAVAEEDPVFAAEVDDDEDDMGFDESSLGGGFESSPAQAPVAAAADATDFPLWVVLLLGGTLFSMTLCGIMGLDLIQSMWAWNEPFSINSALMDGVLGLFG